MFCGEEGGLISRVTWNAREQQARGQTVIAVMELLKAGPNSRRGNSQKK